jgi:hypothetical protein
MTVIAGLVVTLCGLGLALNVMHAADNLAAVNRSFPWWMKSPVADYSVTGRVIGGALAVLGVALILVSLR